MKSSATLRVMAVATLLTAVSGCDEGLTEINRNPNSPDQATAEQLFPNGVEASVSRVFGSGLHMDLTALWAQQYSEFLYTDEDIFRISDGSISGNWGSFYAGPLQDFQEVIEKGVETERPNVAAIGTIMQTWTFHVMTDLWGDIGYSEALQGRDPDASSTPALDSQEQVYTGMFAALTGAQATLAGGGSSFTPASADLIYGGDVEAWQRFANSLRLRMAMRISDVDAATGNAEFNAALAAGVFESNADNAVLGYHDDEVSVHPLYSYQQSRDDHGISATMVDTLKALSDPRLAVYANPTARNGSYQGAPNGSEFDPPIDSISRIGSYFTRADAEAVLMSYAEVLFLQAEAAERGWITADAASLYTDAITASMEQFGIAQAEIDAYLAQPRVAYNGLPSIGVQKWIALYGNGPEAYAEWRRTGYPNLVAGPDALNDGLIPVRLPYPQSEADRNGENLAEAVARQGGAGLNDPLWWDVN
ncbi:MAG TPA: SusD/RagB family nutrient-binding outer membrane lipoprotein [Longimicrobiaceae bacterium]|nr:SusD/RagB family nutrient-binding outer membrane lipoprotein [Longimicrobiaceae bacterium]